MLTQFAKILTQNVLLLREADSAQDQAHRRRSGRSSSSATARQLDTLQAEMGLDDAELSDSTRGRRPSARRWPRSRSSGTSTS